MQHGNTQLSPLPLQPNDRGSLDFFNLLDQETIDSFYEPDSDADIIVGNDTLRQRYNLCSCKMNDYYAKAYHLDFVCERRIIDKDR